MIICISGRFVLYCTFISNKSENIAHTLEGSSPASKDSSRRLSRLDVACILIWLFGPFFTLFYVAVTPLSLQRPFACQLHFLSASQSRVGTEAVAGAGAAAAVAAAAALGGDHSAGVLRAGSPRAPGWVPLQWVLAEVLKRLQPVRPSLPSLPLLSSQSTSKVLTQEKDKGSNR